MIQILQAIRRHPIPKSTLKNTHVYLFVDERF